MTNRYQLQKGPDGVTWLSVEPMIEDIRERMDTADTPEHVVDALHYVKSFLEALVIEANSEANND
jgi:hypothetical protein